MLEGASGGVRAGGEEQPSDEQLRDLVAARSVGPGADLAPDDANDLGTQRRLRGGLGRGRGAEQGRQRTPPARAGAVELDDVTHDSAPLSHRWIGRGLRVLDQFPTLRGCTILDSPRAEVVDPRAGVRPAVRASTSRAPTARSAIAAAESVVLVVDDVATTGATLSAAAIALRAVGAREVDALTAGRTPARGSTTSALGESRMVQPRSVGN